MSYYSRVLIPFVDQFIRENAHRELDSWELDLDSFDDEDLQPFAAHLIRADSDEGEPWLWLNDCDKADDVMFQLTHSLLKYNNARDKVTMSLIKDVAVTANRKRMEKLINERIGDIEINSYADMDLRAHVDKQNGEVSWIPSHGF